MCSRPDSNDVNGFFDYTSSELPYAMRRIDAMARRKAMVTPPSPFWQMRQSGTCPSWASRWHAGFALLEACMFASSSPATCSKRSVCRLLAHVLRSYCVDHVEPCVVRVLVPPRVPSLSGIELSAMQTACVLTMGRNPSSHIVRVKPSVLPRLLGTPPSRGSVRQLVGWGAGGTRRRK